MPQGRILIRPLGGHKTPLNSKNGKSYNHEKLWATEIKNNPAYRPYNKKGFDFYPCRRVQIANDKAAIYLNPNLATDTIIAKIIQIFGLSQISKIKIIKYFSDHYRCCLDN
ncbi:MAG: hypothetical protein FWG65_04695 [Turicibacter sp.]|nr:hypothetical protein [Turicibacter sp.]